MPEVKGDKNRSPRTGWYSTVTRRVRHLRPAPSLVAAAVVGAGLALASPVGALTLTWNTCTDGPETRENVTCQPGGLTPSLRSETSSDPLDTSRRFTFGAIGSPSRTLTVGAYRTTTDLGTGGVLNREIRSFEEGLAAGAESTDNNSHSVDNRGFDEFLVFQFANDGYIPRSFRLGLSFGDSSDIVTYIGGSLGGPNDAFDLFDPPGSFLWTATGGSLVGLGYVRQEFLNVGVGVANLFSRFAAGRYLIIGARNERQPCDLSDFLQLCDAGNDVFLIQQVVGVLPGVVPEPATLAILGPALVGIAAVRRRRRDT